MTEVKIRPASFILHIRIKLQSQCYYIIIIKNGWAWQNAKSNMIETWVFKKLDCKRDF